jgi:hypothetical protein
MLKIKITKIDYSEYRKAHYKAYIGMGLIAMIFGFVFFAWALSAYGTGDAAKEWPTVQGNVIQSKVVSSTDYEGTTYSPQVRYNYTVNGVGYSSTRISPFSGGSSDPNYAIGMVAKYHIGQTVVVTYDPSHPEYSLLETDPGTDSPIFLMAGLLFIVFGVLIVCISIPSRRHRH